MYHPADPPCGCLTPLGDLHNYAPPPAAHSCSQVQGLQDLLQQQEHTGLQPQQLQVQQQMPQQQEQRSQVINPLLQTQPRQGQHCDRFVAQQQLQHAVVQAAACTHSGGSRGDIMHCAASECSSSGTPDSSRCQCTGSADSIPPNAVPTCSRASRSSKLQAATCLPAGANAAPNGTAAVVVPSGAAATEAAATAKTGANAASTPVAAAAAPAYPDTISGDGHFDAAEGCYKIVARCR